jgi:hypothetical protein
MIFTDVVLVRGAANRRYACARRPSKRGSQRIIVP